MKFVTKAEFDKAVETLELAVKNGQVRYGHHDDPEVMIEVLFCNASNTTIVNVSHTSFVPPFMAAQAKLLETRNRLNKHKLEHELKSKSLEDLEKTEKELAKVLVTLKE